MSALCQKQTSARELIHLLKFAWLPRFVEEGLLRTVQPQDHAPAFAGPRLHPVDFLAGRSLGAKIHIHRRVGIDDDALFLAANTWKLFVSLEHRTGLGVVENERPEILGRNVRR